MSIIHTFLSTTEIKLPSQRDSSYLRQKLKVNSALSNLLGKPINKPLLAELLCILDREPITRRNAGQQCRNSKVRVYNASGELIRIECCNGKVIKQLV